MATYSETELLQAAESLLQQARQIAWMLAAKWGILCLVIAVVALGILQAVNKTDEPIGALSIVIALIGTAVGYREGRRRSFELRLGAQKLLVLVEIERNTHR